MNCDLNEIKSVYQVLQYDISCNSIVLRGVTFFVPSAAVNIRYNP